MLVRTKGKVCAGLYCDWFTAFATAANTALLVLHATAALSLWLLLDLAGAEIK